MRRGDQIIVCSQVDMDEWQIRENRKTAIFIDDEVWCLVEKQFTDDKEVRYILDPWPDYARHIPGRRIRYDEEYVRACRELDEKRKFENRYGPVLSLFKWIIGFLPSRMKASIEEKFGVPARNATFISIIVELYLFFAVGALLLIFTVVNFHFQASVFSIPSLIRLVIILSLDLVMRYDSYIRGDASPPGFWEWFFRFLYKRISRLLSRKTAM
jgi:hypothetical protein